MPVEQGDGDRYCADSIALTRHTSTQRDDRPFFDHWFVVSRLRCSLNKLVPPGRHYRESGNPVFLMFPGFRLSQTRPECRGHLCAEFLRHHIKQVTEKQLRMLDGL